MTARRPRFTAWRFLHPDFEAQEEFAGIQLDTRIGVQMVSEDDSIRQAILLLISTTPGERVMRPTYGCWLSRLIFAPNDDTTAGLGIHYVRRALEEWEPRIEILDLDASRDDNEPGLMNLDLTYRVRSSRRVEQLTVPVELTGEAVP